LTVEFDEKIQSHWLDLIRFICNELHNIILSVVDKFDMGFFFWATP